MSNARSPVQAFFDEAAANSGKCLYGAKDLFKALEMSAVETVIVSENLQIKRNANGTGNDSTLLKDWLVAHHKDFGTTLEIVDNNSEDNAKFVSETGGVGCILRWKVDF